MLSRRATLRPVLLTLLGGATLLAVRCGNIPCRSQNECPLGYYCVLDSTADIRATGDCKYDCISADDCPQPGDGVSRAVCDNEGRCATVSRPPRLILLEPETDTLYPEGTRTIRVSGQVETAAAKVTISVKSSALEGNCAGGPPREVVVENASPGSLAHLPFVIDGVLLDTGKSRIQVDAAVGASTKTRSVDVAVECPGCAKIQIDHPARRDSVPGLELPELDGAIEPATPAAALWRVFSYDGEVIDGVMGVSGGRFDVRRIPLFPGLNRVQVVVTGVGHGLGESRCSVLPSSGVASEPGLRAILLWDGAHADLDLHVVGPGGTFGDPASSLSSRGQHPFFLGHIEDAAEGYGPEVATVDHPPDGVYGLVVEPVLDAGDLGTDAFLRVLFEGRLLFVRPAGPQHLTSLDGKLWVVGTVHVTDGAAEWTLIDELVSAAAPPTTAPDAWPRFR